MLHAVCVFHELVGVAPATVDKESANLEHMYWLWTNNGAKGGPGGVVTHRWNPNGRIQTGSTVDVLLADGNVSFAVDGIHLGIAFRLPKGVDMYPAYSSGSAGERCALEEMPE